YDANAKDQMYMQAGRLLYADGVTSNPRTDEARQTYQKVKAALDTPPVLLQRAMDQLERGSELAGALTGAMARGQIAAAQGPISRVISGPVYVVTGGDFDMQEEVASPIERGANNQIAGVRAATRDARQGVQDLVDGYSHARQQGQAFRYLDSLR